ncbi:uncharacterized protein BJ212DRAFT_1474030 [Suillus subaureus]|uniref:Uncharacterized protein n=1 Tax=Suillus subaureus TaxID=48587 RepID=A0A9P7JJV6_9AGAM|nr:uncharacterized protein BJ212DRAFT_1474030 [Suillus subaureus]KAG1826813.1 hypothetical protein BJ212DRAFT_1474030 [Suillus subaureus]
MAGLGTSLQTPGLRLGTSGDDLTEFEDTGTPRVWVTIHARLSRQSHHASTPCHRQALPTNAQAVDITSQLHSTSATRGTEHIAPEMSTSINMAQMNEYAQRPTIMFIVILCAAHVVTLCTS